MVLDLLKKIHLDDGERETAADVIERFANPNWIWTSSNFDYVSNKSRSYPSVKLAAELTVKNDNTVDVTLNFSIYQDTSIFLSFDTKANMHPFTWEPTNLTNEIQFKVNTIQTNITEYIGKTFTIYMKMKDAVQIDTNISLQLLTKSTNEFLRLCRKTPYKIYFTKVYYSYA